MILPTHSVFSIPKQNMLPQNWLTKFQTKQNYLTFYILGCVLNNFCLKFGSANFRWPVLKFEKNELTELCTSRLIKSTVSTLLQKLRETNFFTRVL